MKTEKEKMLAGEYYFANDEELVKERIICKSILKQLNTDGYIFGDNTKAILARLIPNVPDNLYIEPPFHCDYGYNIFCGDKVYFNVNCVLLDVMSITIGSNVFFGPGVHIYTAAHPLDAMQRQKKENARPVRIGR